MIDSVQQDLGRATPFTPSSLPGRTPKSAVPAANLTYAYAGFGAVLGILFGVATAVTLHQNTQVAQTKTIIEPPIVISDDAGVVQAGYAGPEQKDMGPVLAQDYGLRGQLTTSWSEGLSYQLTIAPSDPSHQEAFATTVNDPPRPLSVDLQMKSAAGQVLCDQQVVLKYDPTKTAGLAPAELSRLQAQELDREHASDVFKSILSKDGKVESISSQGTIPCSKTDYDAAAFWAFTPQFPDLHEQALLVKHGAAGAAVEARLTTPKPALAGISTAPRVVAVASHAKTAPALVPVRKVSAAVKGPAPLLPRSVAAAAPAVPVNPETQAVVQAPAAFHFEIEGDDELVDFDAAQKSLQTSAGKTFFVTDALAASSVSGWLDEQVNVHYRCDETSTCTLSLSSAATVLHATMRPHHVTMAQAGSSSVVLALNSADPAGAESPGGPSSFGR